MSVGRLRPAIATGPRRIGELHDRNHLLFAVAALNAALVAVFTGLMAVDRRTLLERSVRTSVSLPAARTQHEVPLAIKFVSVLRENWLIR